MLIFVELYISDKKMIEGGGGAVLHAGMLLHLFVDGFIFDTDFCAAFYSAYFGFVNVIIIGNLLKKSH